MNFAIVVRCWLLCQLCLGCWACEPKDPPVRRYHVRGVVQELIGSAPDLSVAIHHERISGFEDRDGKLGQMASMTMVFGVDKNVPAALFKPGDKIAYDFDVRWNQAPALLLVHAEPLASDTPLVLSKAH